METNNNGFIKYHLPCPLCSSSDAVSMNKDGSAYCFSCQEHIKEYNMETQEIQSTKSTNEYEVKDYLKQSNYAEIVDRNIKEPTCKRYGVTVKMDSVGTITNHYYPYHDKQGAKIATKTRYTKLKEFSLQGNTKVSGLFGEHLFSKNKYIIITEGELDCLSAYQMFKTDRYETPVVSIKNGITSAVKDIKGSLDWLEKFDNVIINFDNDEQGRVGALKVAELFSPGKCKILHLPEGYKDASDCLQKNKIQIYTKAFWDAKLYAPDGIINANILFDDITKPNLKSFVQYPFEGMNKITYGIRPSELITFTAGSGLGKTQVMREVVHHMIKSTDQSHGDERRALDEIMTRLRTLVQETGVAMIVVSHLRRPEGKGHEEGAATSLSQLRGSASIGQLSDMVIGLERDAQNDDPDVRNTTRVRVLKNRFSGLTGPCCDLRYDADTGRLKEVEVDEI